MTKFRFVAGRSLITVSLFTLTLGGSLASCGSDADGGGSDTVAPGSAGAGGASAASNTPPAAAGTPGAAGTSTEAQMPVALDPNATPADPGAAAAAGMMGCPVAPPVVGEMCMGMPGTCTFPNLECDCDGGEWVCWDPSTCPAAADPAGACATDGQICEYPELLSCECDGAVWECDRDCPAELPADGVACPELTQECGYSTVMGNGDEVACVCGDTGWACTACPATSPPPAPNLLACPLLDQECSYDVAAVGNIPAGDNDCTCDATGWLCVFDPECPETLPADLLECAQVGQDCDYPATGGEEECECDATGWLCTFVPDCPLTEPADGVACGLVGQDCDYDGVDPANPGETECTCTDAGGTAGWACIFEPDCPDALPATTLACTLAAQVCDYDNDVGPGGVGGEDVCTCTAETWDCQYQPPCPDVVPVGDDVACPAPTQECGYSTVQGGGNEIECICTDDVWACVDETAVAPPAAPAP